ncbi:MAG: hypothetical protein HYX79_04390 [Chloroflexi bacterium]|nr:hypothetical protein [Chloroflexota bacterium]
MAKAWKSILFIIVIFTSIIMGERNTIPQKSETEMSKRRFIMWVLVTLGISISITHTITFIFRRNWLQVLQEPDTALAFIALFMAFSIWTQQAIHLRGVSYYLRNTTEREKTDPSLIPVPQKGYPMILGKLHWISLILFVFFFVQLVAGTIVKYSNLGNEITKQDIQELIESNQELKQNHEDMQELIKRVDNALKQNSEILKRLDAQNVAGNSTTTKIQ